MLLENFISSGGKERLVERIMSLLEQESQNRGWKRAILAEQQVGVGFGGSSAIMRIQREMMQFLERWVWER